MSVRVFADVAAAAAAAADEVVRLAGEAIGARGRFELAVSGGRTPEALFAALVAEPRRERLEPARIHVWFADERAVSPEDPASNYRLARVALFDPLGIPAAHVHRMEGERSDLMCAASEYARTLPARFDLVLLGLGEDGHIASLFPGSPLVDEHVSTVAAVFDSPKPPPRRLTLTPPVLGAARRVLVLVTGDDKRAAVARALASEGTSGETPARLVRGRDWVLDRAAAGDAVNA